MVGYLTKRVFYLVPILIGVNLLTFSLFFLINTPEDMARFNLGEKHVTTQAIEAWKQRFGYDKPLLFNETQKGFARVSDTIFFQKSLKLFLFDFGYSDTGRDINYDIYQRMWPSLAIAFPSLVIGIFVNIFVAFLIVFFKNTYLALSGIIFCIIMMSISGLFYIIGGQYLIATLFKWVPISGYAPGIDAMKFLLLPVLIGIVSGMGTGARWYRTLFLEEIHKDYVRLARAKGLSEAVVLRKHILRNALIPILTGVVVLLPLLFLGSLLTESFFGIPGLGSYTIDAIHQQDFAIVRCIVFLGAILYCVGLMLTDIAYTLVDPRVRLGK